MITAENIWKMQALSYFTAEEISDAKSELWKSCGDVFIGKMIKRQGISKTKADLDDISLSLKTLSVNDVMPTFIASSTMIKQTPLFKPEASVNSSDEIVNRLKFLEESINTALFNYDTAVNNNDVIVNRLKTLEDAINATLFNPNSANSSNDEIVNRLNILENSINAALYTREGTMPIENVTENGRANIIVSSPPNNSNADKTWRDVVTGDNNIHAVNNPSSIQRGREMLAEVYKIEFYMAQRKMRTITIH